MRIARPQPWPVLAVFILLALSALTRSGQPDTPATQPTDPASPSITIYSDMDFVQADSSAQPDPQRSYAIINETRRLNFTSGENQLDLAGIPTGIHPMSLTIRPPSSRNITLIEHTCVASATTPDDILRSHVGHDLIINRRQPGTSDTTGRPETITGRLLAFDRNSLLIQTNNRQLPIEIIPRSSVITEIKFVAPVAPSSLSPTVACRFLSDTAGPADIQLSYQTTGFWWQCAYNVVLRDNDRLADLESWVRIGNSSGIPYPRVNLRLGIAPRPAGEMPTDLASPLYTVSRPVALPGNGTQQIAFLSPRRNLPLSRVYVYRPMLAAKDPGQKDPGQPAAPNASALELCLMLNNDEKQNLGTPLPPGRVNVYREPAPNQPPVLVGQETLPATPLGRPILLKLAAAQGIVGQRETIVAKEPKADGTAQSTESIQITVHNSGPQPIRAIVLDTLPCPGAQVLDASQRPDWQDARSVQFSLDIAPNAQGKVTYRARPTAAVNQ